MEERRESSADVTATRLPGCTYSMIHNLGGKRSTQSPVIQIWKNRKVQVTETAALTLSGNTAMYTIAKPYLRL